MKKLTAVCALALALTMALAPAAYAAEWAGVPHASPATRVAWGTEEQGSEHSFRRQAETEQSGLCDDVVCYPSSVTQSEDGTEIRKFYDLSPEDDPTGIPRSDFEQDGYHYTLVDLLKQELPEHESRQHTETVTLDSKNKDMASVLALLPQEKAFVTDDGLAGTLTLRLDTVQVEVAGYGSSTRQVSATRTYPNLAGQDTQYIPKTIQDGGRTLTLQDCQRQ